MHAAAVTPAAGVGTVPSHAHSEPARGKPAGALFACFVWWLCWLQPCHKHVTAHFMPALAWQGGRPRVVPPRAGKRGLGGEPARLRRKHVPRALRGGASVALAWLGFCLACVHQNRMPVWICKCSRGSCAADPCAALVGTHDHPPSLCYVSFPSAAGQPRGSGPRGGATAEGGQRCLPARRTRTAGGCARRGAGAGCACGSAAQGGRLPSGGYGGLRAA